jgi:hypothetical protein
VTEEAAIMFTVLAFVGGGVTLLVASMNNRRRLREMQYRERLAMIQSGLIPSPELDPAAFEAGTGLAPRAPARGERYRTAGVAMIGLGLGLMVLIAGAFNEFGIGLGVGGAWVMLGGALLANYLLMRGESAPDPVVWTPPKPRGPEPPSNVTP